MKQLLNSTSIPNKLLEKLYVANSEYTGNEKDILLYICRKTIGWQKDTDWLTLNLMVKETGKKKSSISTTLKSLLNKQAITKERHGKLGWVIGLNLDTFGSYEQLANNEQIVSSQLTDSSLSANQSVSSQLTPSYKTNIYTKETNTKGLHKTIISLLGQWKTINPVYKTWWNNTTQLKACEFLLTDEGINQKQLAYIVKNLDTISNMEFCPNITTPHMLLKNFSRVVTLIKQNQADKKKACWKIS